VRTLKLTLAYDGTAYAGWQVQPGQSTVQQTLEAALEKVAGETIRVLASGRTDAGVHALGQVVGFQTDSGLSPEALRRALNANLPDDVAVLDVAEAPQGFHPISHAHRKRYRYVVHDGPVRDVFSRRFVWHYSGGRLDADAMHRAAAGLLGTHDFRSFETAGAERSTSVRTVFDIFVRRGEEGLGIGDWGLAVADQPHTHGDRSLYLDRDDFLTIEIEADGFLYNMVRAIVGTLVEVGRGRRPEPWPAEVLRATDRRMAGPTAPPQGLALVKVEY
jgi:tRNA pseudouridine38-40 synthase